jgi:hypothetical protein
MTTDGLCDTAIVGDFPYNLREITAMSVQPLCVLEGGLPYNVREITGMSVQPLFV